MTTAPIKLSEADDGQRANYLEVGLQTEATLEKAITLLKVRQALTGAPDENRLILVTLLDLEAELAKVHAELLVFLADEKPFRPPTDTDLIALKEIVKGLDEMVANAVTATAIVRLTTTLLGLWQQTRA